MLVELVNSLADFSPDRAFNTVEEIDAEICRLGVIQGKSMRDRNARTRNTSNEDQIRRLGDLKRKLQGKN